MLLPRASSPQHSPAGLRLWLRGDPRTSGSGRKTGRSRPGIWRGSLPSDRPKYPVPCLAWRVAHRAWPTQATHNGEVVVIGLCLVPIPGIQRHRVHSKQHFGRRITLCQLFGSATACVWGEGCWVMIPNWPSAFHPAHTWIEGLPWDVHWKEELRTCHAPKNLVSRGRAGGGAVQRRS